MGATDSNLSSKGFDYVVAVTQDSINAKLRKDLYLQKGPEVILCYVYDDNNQLTQTDYATLVSNAKGTDPLSLPDGTAGTDQRVQNLSNAGFSFVIRAQLGLPPGVDPRSCPIITLKPGNSSVTYTMLFSEFIGAQLSYLPRGRLSWFNQSQPSGTPWTFSGDVDLNFQDSNFEALPHALQRRLKDIGDPNMFSIQQLYYDLNSTALEQKFTFNIPPNCPLNDFMEGNFIGTYMGALKNQGGGEILGWGATTQGVSPDWTADPNFYVTDVNHFTPNSVGTSGAPLALNYLCALNNNSLPDTTHAGFGWNWIEASETDQYDGVAAVNRNTFVQYLNGILLPYVQRNCWHPHVTVTYVGGLNNEVDYTFPLTPEQNPSVNTPATGTTLLSYSFSDSSSDQAGINGDEGKMSLSTSFNLDVSVTGNQMTIVQHLVLYCYVSYLTMHTDANNGNVVDRKITDTYSFGVDDQGNLVVSQPSSSASPPTSVTVDNSIGFNAPFWRESPDFANYVNRIKEVLSAGVTDIQLDNLGGFVFPGGSTFAFAAVSFSSYQDLVAHITYVDRP